jgi:signal transduction histidine kinase
VTRGGLRWGTRSRARVTSAVILLLLAFAHLCSIATQGEPPLGVRAGIGQRGLELEWVQPGSLAWDAGLRAGDVVTSVDGFPATVADLPQIDRAHGVEVRTATGQVVRAETTGRVVVESYHRVLFFAIAAVFAAMGAVVFVLAANVLAALVFFATAVSVAVMLLAATASAFGAQWPFVAVFGGLMGLGSSTLLFMLVFPTNLLQAWKVRAVMGLWLAGHLALMPLYVLVMTTLTSGYSEVLSLALFIVLIDLVAAGIAFARSLHQSWRSEPHARRSLATIGLGMCVGLTPFLVLSVVPYLIGRGAVVAPELSIATIVAIPASAGMAVLSRQFLGIERILRRGLVAVLVWVVLIFGYTLGVDSLQSELARRTDGGVAALGTSALAVVVIAVTFAPLQHRLRMWMEAKLFRDVYSYAETLHDLGQEIVRTNGMQAIATTVLGRLTATLDLSWATIVLQPPAGPTITYGWGSPNSRARKLLESTDLWALPRTPAAEHDWYGHAARLMTDAAPVGMLVTGPKRQDLELSPEDARLIDTLATLVAPALQNAVLVSRLREQVTALEVREGELAALSTRLMQAEEDERRRIALDLHDDPLQRATALIREMGPDSGIEDQERARWHAQVEEIIESLRAICNGLYPSVMDDVGLVAGLDWLVSDVCARSDVSAGLQVELGSQGVPPQLPTDLEVALYRVAQEALNNCLKHAEASSVNVALSVDERRVLLEVADDGCGFQATTPDRPDVPHLGILGMQHRVRPWRGTVLLRPAVGHGTVVTVEVPR